MRDSAFARREIDARSGVTSTDASVLGSVASRACLQRVRRQRSHTDEQWRVDALDAGDHVIASQLSPLGTGSPGPYDAKPWTFAFSNLPSGFDKVRMTFIGTKTNGVGLAFNNFS